jgi:hypothetical protein
MFHMEHLQFKAKRSQKNTKESLTLYIYKRGIMDTGESGCAVFLSLYRGNRGIMDTGESGGVV